MNLSSADIYTDFSGFSRLRAQARDGGAQARKDVAEQMEAMFVSLMLKSMRQAGEAFGASSAGVERDLYDSQLALGMARNGRLGFAQTMLRELDPAAGAGAPASGAFPAPVRNVALPARDWAEVREARVASRDAARTGAPVAAAPVAAAGDGAREWDSPDAFATALWPAASRAAEALGTRPEAVLAVAALETGWGRHMPSRADGTSSFNLFGIKAHGWDGDVTHHATLEFEHGAFARRVEPFRAYPSPEAAVEDFARFLGANPRYREALAAGDDPVRFVHELHRAGYATDPRYGEKLESVLRSEPIRRAAAAASASA